MGRWIFLLPIVVLGCARASAEPAVASDVPIAAGRPGLRQDAQELFAIYEADDSHDITAGLSSLPPGFEIFHERDEPKRGYVFATLEGEGQATVIDRLRAWSVGLALPEGDRLLFGKTTRDGARTYLVRSTPVLDASGVAGAMANPLGGDQWGVALTFTADAAQSLMRALGGSRHRFRVVVQGFVEQDRFELVDEHSRDPLAGPHGSLSTTDWVCSDHRAILKMTSSAGVPAKTRATSLAAALPPFREARVCREERVLPRP